MPSLEQIFPPFGLRITAGPIELRPLTDDVIPLLVDLVLDGIHAPDFMPFALPWTLEPREKLPYNTASFYWTSRGSWSPAKWTLTTVVFYEGVCVGVQDFVAKNFAVTRTGETGSWLGLSHQGRGIGTLMRQTMCAFLFDHLGATRLNSAALFDNEPSDRVSRKLGYRDNGEDLLDRMGTAALVRRFVLTPETFVRHDHPMIVEGLEPFRRFVGLDRETPASTDTADDQPEGNDTKARS